MMKIPLIIKVTLVEHFLTVALLNLIQTIQKLREQTL